MHLLSRVGSFQGRKAASAVSIRVWVVPIQHRLIRLRCSNNSISLRHVFISVSHSLPHFPVSPLHSRHLSPVWPFSVLCFPSLSTPPPLTHLLLLCLFPSSGLVCHQCGLFCWCDGAPDADTDSGGVHAVSSGFLQCLWALHGRRHKEGEAPSWRQQRRGRQEEFWESLWQGQPRQTFTWTSIEMLFFALKALWQMLLKCLGFDSQRPEV